MASIPSPGVGSGLDVNSIVSQLMAIERRPLLQLAAREAERQAEISAFGSLRSAVSQLRSAVGALGKESTFQALKASSSDGEVLSVSTDESAAVSNFSVVVDRLAQRHKTASAEFNDTDTFGGNDGDGMTLTVETESFTLDLSTAKTLEQIRDAINAEDNATGVSAVVVNGDSGKQKLVLTSGETGFDSRVQPSYQGAITDTTFNFATINQNADGDPIADDNELDASLVVEGVSITRGSNDVDEVIDGVTLHLEASGEAQVDVTRDNTPISSGVQALVSAFNALRGQMSSLSEDQLGADSLLLSIESQIRSAFNTRIAVGGSYAFVQQIGLSSTDSGDLQLDANTLNTAIEEDLEGLAALFADGEEGFAVKLDTILQRIVETDGLIDSRVDSLNSRISSLDTRRGSLERRLEGTEERLRAQFTALDQLVSQLQTTSNFLAQQLTTLQTAFITNS